MYRGWINQPSKMQPLHRLHGTRVLVQVEDCLYGGTNTRVWFLDGDTISMIVPPGTVSMGWYTQPRCPDCLSSQTVAVPLDGGNYATKFRHRSGCRVE